MSAHTDDVQVVDRGSVEHYTWGAGCDGWRLLRFADLAVIEERVPAGAAEVRHVHARARQFFYVLSGRARIEIEDRAVEFTAGQGVHLPAGVPHRFLNPGDADVHFLVISAPSTAGDRVDLPQV